MILRISTQRILSNSKQRILYNLYKKDPWISEQGILDILTEWILGISKHGILRISTQRILGISTQRILGTYTKRILEFLNKEFLTFWQNGTLEFLYKGSFLGIVTKDFNKQSQEVLFRGPKKKFERSGWSLEMGFCSTNYFPWLYSYLIGRFSTEIFSRGQRNLTFLN